VDLFGTAEAAPSRLDQAYLSGFMRDVCDVY
jgi:hypothetical protein